MINELRKESPEFVRLSLAAAMTLRFASGMFYRDTRLYCINLLLTYSSGCVGRCSYCGLSGERDGAYEDKSFIRVDWPVYRLTTVVERLNKYAPWVERVCISMITNKQAVDDTITIIRHISDGVDLPISLLVSPTIMDASILKGFKDAGAGMIGVAIDTATEGLFDQHRGKGVKGPHRWEKYWQVLEDAVNIFGRNKAGCHLVVGLGETERQMVETVQRVRDLGARTHLFSFYPEQGSALSDMSQADAGTYRRIQLARYLIDHDLILIDGMGFDERGQITNFGLNGSQLEEIINSGKPFQTSGCPGKTMEGACNRPFGDGPPSDIRSFPFELNKNDVNKVQRQMVSVGAGSKPAPTSLNK